MSREEHENAHIFFFIPGILVNRFSKSLNESENTNIYNLFLHLFKKYPGNNTSSQTRTLIRIIAVDSYCLLAFLISIGLNLKLKNEKQNSNPQRPWLNNRLCQLVRWRIKK